MHLASKGSVSVGRNWNSAGSLLRDLSQVTRIQEPSCLPCIFIVAAEIKFLNSNQAIPHSAADMISSRRPEASRRASFAHLPCQGTSRLGSSAVHSNSNGARPSCQVMRWFSLARGVLPARTVATTVKQEPRDPSCTQPEVSKH